MKYTSEQISSAWKSYVASRHSTQRRDDGGEIKHKHKLKHKKEQKEIASSDAQVEHGRSSASTTQHRAGGGIIEGKPGIDTNDGKLRPGAFVIPKEKVPDAIKDGILRPKKAEKFQEGGVPVKLTAGEGLLSPERAAGLHAQGVDLNEYAPDTDYPYSPDSLLGMQYGGAMPAGERLSTGHDTDTRPGSRIILPQDRLFDMGRRVGVGIDVHGRDTTMTFPQMDKTKMTWMIKNKQAIFDPHAALTTGAGMDDGGGVGMKKGGMHIKKSHRGLLHKQLGVPESQKIPASKLTDKPGDSAATKKRKVFARNAKKWKHDDGGEIRELQDGGVSSLSGFKLQDPYAVVDAKRNAIADTKPSAVKVNEPAAPVKNAQSKTNYKTKSKNKTTTPAKETIQEENTPSNPFTYVFSNMHPENMLSAFAHDKMNTIPDQPKDTSNLGDSERELILKNIGRYKGGKIKMQRGGNVLNTELSDPFSKTSLSDAKADPDYSFFNPGKSDNILGMSDRFFNPENTKLIDTPAEIPNIKQVTATDNENRLRNSILGDTPLNATNTPTAAVTLPDSKSVKQPLSLFDQARKDEKRYTDVTAATDLALLAGNLGSRYVPTPRPKAYTPDIYERNVNAEATEAGKNLDKEAATARYNARNTGQSRVVAPAVTADLMDKRLALGAQTDEARETERKSVYEQRNQASLMNLNQNNTYNTMEANRLADFRKEKGQESMMMVDRLQDLYKSSIEDKYAIKGAENQAKIAKEQATSQWLTSYGISPSQAVQNKYSSDYDNWSQKLGHTPTAEDIKKFQDDWKIQNPS